MKNALRNAAFVLLLAVAPAQAQINLGKLKDNVQKVTDKVDQVSKKAGNIGDRAQKVSNGDVSAVTGTSSSNDTEYYSDNSITFSKTRGGKAEKNFTINDNIYATVTLKQPLINFLKEEGLENEPYYDMPISLVYIINRAARGEFTSVRIPKEDYGKKTLVLDILPGKGEAKSQYLAGGQYSSRIAQPLSAFDEGMGTSATYGTQKYDFTFGPNNLYHGAFNFTVKNRAEQKIMAQRVEDAQNDMGDVIASDAKLPAEFSTPGKFSDPQLSLANIKSMISGEGFTLLKVVIDAAKGNDYYIHKNALDIPEYKVTAKPVWVAFKGRDGKCYFTKEYFTRQYEGGGKYGPLEQAATSASNTQIACENIK